MKSAARVLYVMGGTFLLIDVVYLVWSLMADNFEVIGLITVGLSAVLCLLLAFYFGRTVSALGAYEWAEDRPEAEIDEGDPEIGHFSPWSWWPVMLAASITLVVLGLAISVWISLIGIPLFVVSLLGWIYEYNRGYFAR